MPQSPTLINNVSDTALWVAYYRAKETDRLNSLFKDPLAKRLIGERGKQIALQMEKVGRHSEFTVVMRTVIIDDFINESLNQVDTVVNLGAGLDTRPYRMDLPENLNWIEVDYPHLIQYKNEVLKNEIPKCHLQRVAVDLADDQKRKEFLQAIALKSKKALIITEGVILYLTEDQVAALANDLHAFPQFAFWIAEYMDPKIYRYLQTPERMKKMKNAPFKFFPTDWLGFFKKNSWVPIDIKYFGIEGAKHNRYMPMPWWAILFRLLAPKATLEKSRSMAGFMLLKQANQSDK